VILYLLHLRVYFYFLCNVCLFFSQGGQLVGLMPVLAACHLIYVFSVVLQCISIHVVANKVLYLSPWVLWTARYYTISRILALC